MQKQLDYQFVSGLPVSWYWVHGQWATLSHLKIKSQFLHSIPHFFGLVPKEEYLISILSSIWSGLLTSPSECTYLLSFRIYVPTRNDPNTHEHTTILIAHIPQVVRSSLSVKFQFNNDLKTC